MFCYRCLLTCRAWAPFPGKTNMMAAVVLTSRDSLVGHHLVGRYLVGRHLEAPHPGGRRRRLEGRQLSGPGLACTLVVAPSTRSDVAVGSIAVPA